MARGKRRSFTAERKKKVIAYAEQHGNRAAGRQFNVSERNVRQWRKNKAIIEVMPRRKRSMRGGHTKYPALEEALKQYVLSVPPQQKANMVPKDIRKIANQMAKDDFDIKDFQANPSWVFRFIKRHNLNVERRKKKKDGETTAKPKSVKKARKSPAPSTLPAPGVTTTATTCMHSDHHPDDKPFQDIMFHPVNTSMDCLPGEGKSNVDSPSSFMHRMPMATVATSIPTTTMVNNPNANSESYFRLTNEICRTINSDSMMAAAAAASMWDVQTSQPTSVQQQQQSQSHLHAGGGGGGGGGGIPSASYSI